MLVPSAPVTTMLSSGCSAEFAFTEWAELAVSTPVLIGAPFDLEGPNCPTPGPGLELVDMYI